MAHLDTAGTVALVEIKGRFVDRDAVQGPTVCPAQRTCHCQFAWSLDDLGDTTAVFYQHELRRGEAAKPYASVGVEAYAIRRPLADVSEESAVA